MHVLAPNSYIDSHPSPMLPVALRLSSWPWSGIVIVDGTMATTSVATIVIILMVITVVIDVVIAC